MVVVPVQQAGTQGAADQIRGHHRASSSHASPEGGFWRMRGCHAQLMHRDPTFLVSYNNLQSLPGESVE